jgi:mRNA-degrading endonuclease RelE of RelBE toxin-antitoxin system
VNSGDFEIVWSSHARRSLSWLPEKYAAAVVEFVYRSLAVNPARMGKALRFELEGLHSARRGDYRVIYRIKLDDHRIEIMAVEHRSDAYRRR